VDGLKLKMDTPVPQLQIMYCELLTCIKIQNDYDDDDDDSGKGKGKAHSSTGHEGPERE
jgi:hypothetical protein